MVIFRSNFSVFLSFNTQLTQLNASNLLNFDPSNRFLPIASQSWCNGVSKMATYIYSDLFHILLFQNDTCKDNRIESLM